MTDVEINQLNKLADDIQLDLDRARAKLTAIRYLLGQAATAKTATTKNGQGSGMSHSTVIGGAFHEQR